MTTQNEQQQTLASIWVDRFNGWRADAEANDIRDFSEWFTYNDEDVLEASDDLCRITFTDGSVLSYDARYNEPWGEE